MFSFDRQPTLTGPTLVVRPLAERDRAALRRAAADPLIWEQHPADRHRPEEFDAFFDESLASGGALVVETADGEVIGSSRYHALDVRSSSVEIGWTFLARRFWGGTTNRELKALMLDHAFTGVEKVVFLVAPTNLRSQLAVEKLGAQRRSEPDARGYVTYELTRGRWQQVAKTTRA